MKQSTKYILAALLIVAGVAALNYFTPAGKNLQGKLSPEVSLSTLTISEGTLELGDEIGYLSDSSVLNFKLTPSASSAAVSELSFKVKSSGLKSMSSSDWKVYPVTSGAIDYTKQVGKGSSKTGTTLTVSMYDGSYGSSYAQKLSGAEEFVLTANIADDGKDNTNTLTVSSTSTAKWINRTKVKKSYSTSSWYTILTGAVSSALSS